MENEGLASDCLHIIKEQSKRKDIVIFLLIVIIFLNNLAWLVAWNLPIEEIETETYELQGDNESNVFYNGEGEVIFNGEKKEREHNNNKNEEENSER